MGLVGRFQEWRIDRLTDRLARRPHGRGARETYGADDVHSFLWEPVLASLALGPDDRLLEPASGRVAIMTTAPEAKGTPAAPYPLATRGHFYADDELVRLAREAGFSSAEIAHREPWGQLLAARP